MVHEATQSRTQRGATPAKAREPLPGPNGPGRAPFRGRRLRILLANGDVAIRRLAATALRKLGHDVTDVVDNTTGAVVGMAIGLVAAAALRPWRARVGPRH